MPQFETTYLVSQVFWLVISFGVLYLGVRFIVFPLFDSIFNARQKKIDTLLNQAEKLTKEAEELEKKNSSAQHQQEEKHHQKIAQAQEKAQKDFQITLEKNEKNLIKLFQNHIQKMEREEKAVLKSVDTFIAKGQKGSL